jgi:hypothetical protein
MPGALKSLVATQFVTTVAAIYYTAPQALQNSVSALHSYIIANVDSAPHTFTLHNVPSGGAASAGNKIMPEVSIPAKTTWIGRYADEPFCVIPAGGTLQALADANSAVTFTVAGREHQ